MATDSFITSESGNQVPAYGTQPEKPGLYLALFHGRVRPDEQMNDWGFNGPIIGPLEWVHTTYALHVRLKFMSSTDEILYFEKSECPDAHDIYAADDMVVYGDKYYGDWSVFFVKEEETRKPTDTFRRGGRRNPAFRTDIKRQAKM